MRYALILLLLLGCKNPEPATFGQHTGKVLSVQYDPYEDRTIVAMAGLSRPLWLQGHVDVGVEGEVATVRWRMYCYKLYYMPSEK